MWLDTIIDALNFVFDPLGGAALVALFYWFRFHTSKGTRSYTTKPLFLFGVLAFMIPFVALYMMLQGGLHPLASIWVLILVWLIPVIPAAWRNFCQRLADIPTGALALRAELAAAPFQVPPGDEPVLQRRLARIGYRVDDFRAVQSTAIQSRFMKISAIMFHLERWAADREGFMDRNSEQYAELLAVFDVLCFRTVRVLKSCAEIYGAIMEDSQVEPDDWQALDSLSTRHSAVSQLQLAAQTAAGCMLEDLRKDMDSLLNNLMLFAVRAALAGEWRLARSKQRLGAIGFTLEPPPPGIMIFVAAVTGFTFVWCLLWLFVSGTMIEMPGDRSAGMMRTLLLTPLYFIANFSLVYYFKRQFAFANENIFGRLPLGFILSVGIAGALLTLPVQIWFDLSQFPGRSGVVLHDLPILIFPWGIGTMAALLVQDSTWDRRSQTTRQMRDGLVFGGGMTVMLWLLLAIHQAIDIPVMEISDEVSGWWFVAKFVLPTFAFGFIIGYAMIGRLREAAARCPAKRPVLASAALASA